MDELTQTTMRAQSEEQGGSFAYFIQILGQTYVNLGQFNHAMSLFEKAFAFAEMGHYQQIQARILTGMAEIYRHWGDFVRAMTCHTTAIDLLDRIGAKCDLAEALLQQGITYQAMGETNMSQSNFTHAMQLFQAMNAPRQVEKVMRFVN
jgi:tetratricopeptide (TPR) repeat protein